MGEPEWCCDVVVNAPDPHWVHPKSILYVCTCYCTLLICGWASEPIIIEWQMAWCGAVLENRGKARAEWHSGVMVEAANSSRLHPTSILCIKVLLHIVDKLCNMGICTNACTAKSTTWLGWWITFPLKWNKASEYKVACVSGQEEKIMSLF